MAMMACGSKNAMKITNMNRTDIFSPQFPEDYLNNMDCSWVILAKDNERIKLSLKEGELEEKY